MADIIGMPEFYQKLNRELRTSLSSAVTRKRPSNTRLSLADISGGLTTVCMNYSYITVSNEEIPIYFSRSEQGEAAQEARKKLFKDARDSVKTILTKESTPAGHAESLTTARLYYDASAQLDGWFHAIQANYAAAGPLRYGRDASSNTPFMEVNNYLYQKSIEAGRPSRYMEIILTLGGDGRLIIDFVNPNPLVDLEPLYISFERPNPFSAGNTNAMLDLVKKVIADGGYWPSLISSLNSQKAIKIAIDLYENRFGSGNLGEVPGAFGFHRDLPSPTRAGTYNYILKYLALCFDNSRNTLGTELVALTGQEALYKAITPLDPDAINRVIFRQLLGPCATVGFNDKELIHSSPLTRRGPTCSGLVDRVNVAGINVTNRQPVLQTDVEVNFHGVDGEQFGECRTDNNPSSGVRRNFFRVWILETTGTQHDPPLKHHTYHRISEAITEWSGSTENVGCLNIVAGSTQISQAFRIDVEQARATRRGVGDTTSLSKCAESLYDDRVPGRARSLGINKGFNDILKTLKAKFGRKTQGGKKSSKKKIYTRKFSQKKGVRLSRKKKK